VKQKEAAKDLPLPCYETTGSSGMDLVACVEGEVLLKPGEVSLVPTGLFISLPLGYEAQVRPRSGLAAKHAVTVVNTPGTIDADYRGEVQVILGNVGKEPFTIRRGMRIAQMVIQKVIRANLVVVEELDGTARGAGGFGHTGMESKRW